MTIRRGLLPRSPARHSRIHPPYGKRFGEICPEKSTRVLDLLHKSYPCVTSSCCLDRQTRPLVLGRACGPARAPSPRDSARHDSLFKSRAGVRLRRHDFRSDQFSFGIVLYELAAGKNPFERSSVAVSMGAVISLEWNCGTHTYSARNSWNAGYSPRNYSSRCAVVGSTRPARRMTGVPD